MENHWSYFLIFKTVTCHLFWLITFHLKCSYICNFTCYLKLWHVFVSPETGGFAAEALPNYFDYETRSEGEDHVSYQKQVRYGIDNETSTILYLKKTACMTWSRPTLAPGMLHT